MLGTDKKVLFIGIHDLCSGCQKRFLLYYFSHFCKIWLLIDFLQLFTKPDQCAMGKGRCLGRTQKYFFSAAMIYGQAAKSVFFSVLFSFLQNTTRRRRGEETFDLEPLSQHVKINLNEIISCWSKRLSIQV